MNFVAIDFETANYTPTSACAIGLAVVCEGKIVESFYSLIKPEPFWFVPEFTDLHGISAEDTKNAKTFDRLWPAIHKQIKGKALLAHNAPFDRNVLKSCLDFYGIRVTQPDFFCSLRMARAAYPSASTNNLAAVCQRLGIELTHHQAESDAIACAKAAIHICSSQKAEFNSAKLPPMAWDFEC